MPPELQNESYLRLLLDSTAAAFYAVDCEGVTTHCNKAFLEMLGFEKSEDVIGRKLHDVIHHSHADGSHYPVDDCPIYNAAKGGSASHVDDEVFFTVNGGSIPVEYWTQPIIKDGKRHGAICTFVDITERKQAESDLQESDQRVRLIIDTALDGVVITDAEGIIIEWNRQAEVIFGWTHEEAIGSQMSERIIPVEYREAHDAGMQRFLTTGEQRILNKRIEITALNKEGKVFPVELTVTAQKFKGRTTFTAFVRDITARKETEEIIIQARNVAENANMAKTEFLANMSHEIRTPMNAVIGLSNILAMSQPLTQKQQDYIKTLQTSADSLLSLINDLLDIAKIESHNLQLEQVPFSLTQMMQEIVSMMAVRVKEKGLSFTGDGECVHHRVFLGDPARLRQIVLNLCSNAIKFTEKGGVHVSITCEPTEKPDIEMICIAVQDTGIGIAAENLDTIFQKFIQADSSISRKYGGTGLGLAITKTLAEAMGGTITVESMPGQGSTFTARVPLALAADQNVELTEKLMPQIFESISRSAPRPLVLLVEDYAPNIMVAQAFLDQFGYECDVAGSGSEALEKAKKGGYALALMDVQMHGMNGLEATQLIRQHEGQNQLARLPIIGMTAHALRGDRERCLGVGMDDYISKPFNPVELQEKIKAALKRSEK